MSLEVVLKALQQLRPSEHIKILLSCGRYQHKCKRGWIASYRFSIVVASVTIIIDTAAVTVLPPPMIKNPDEIHISLRGIPM
jgi:hypothetical protein